MVEGFPLELRVLFKRKQAPAYKLWAHSPEEAEQKVRKQLERPGVLYYGALPRAEDNSLDIVAGRVLWADCDDPLSVKALDDFDPPNVVVESGSLTDGVPHVQALWFLDELLRPEEIRLGCRKLAHTLGADMGSAEQSRILKVPGTLDVKPGARVAELVRLSKAPYRAGRLTAGLTAPEDRAGRTDQANGKQPAPTANGNGRGDEWWMDTLTSVRGIDEGRHEAFMAVCGLLVVKADTMQPHQLCEVAIAWAEARQNPVYPREELERCFYDVWDKEYTRRYGKASS